MWQGERLPGKLIVLEGTDSVGRSTQITRLRTWLEAGGHAVVDTGLNRSLLTQPGLDAAKKGHALGRTTLSLFYATDFADRHENQILPALKAGFYVLADRYFYSICARDIVRGADPSWTRGIYEFALVPDLVLYLRVDLDHLIDRVVSGTGFNYWESGLDIGLGDNLYDSFCEYQTRLMAQLDRMVDEYNFQSVDANRPPDEILADLKGRIAAITRSE
ncbi:MAG: thymidylate kinase [Armatimonadetes bacterium]|nr:thymidylate kinase [Armatimonadota bacterium]MDE2206446.1 thymidylate kinase [Armatimonadota bacterium]